MAQKRIYALFDKQLNSFLNPLVFTTDGEAIRWFEGIVNREDDNNQIYYHYNDYSLHYLGSMDDKSGEFDTQTKRIMEGAGVKRTEKQLSFDDILELIERKYDQQGNVRNIANA